MIFRAGELDVERVVRGCERDPADPAFYGERNDRMPHFGADGILTEKSIALIADWLRGSWYEPSGEIRMTNAK